MWRWQLSTQTTTLIGQTKRCYSWQTGTQFASISTKSLAPLASSFIVKMSYKTKNTRNQKVVEVLVLWKYFFKLLLQPLSPCGAFLLHNYLTGSLLYFIWQRVYFSLTQLPSNCFKLTYNFCNEFFSVQSQVSAKVFLPKKRRSKRLKLR